MANYITTLQAENKALRDRIAAVEDLVLLFRAHLASPKFQGQDTDGERKDWIATADVDARLVAIWHATAAGEG